MNHSIKKQNVIRIGKVIIFILLAAGLAACYKNSATPGPARTVIETATSTPVTEATPTSTPASSQTPALWATATLSPGEFFVPTLSPDQQIYTDPAGWYSVYFPADLEPADQENRFSKEDRFFETGYLPELGSMSNAQNVCAWLANVVEEEPENFTIRWMPQYVGDADCSIWTEPGMGDQIQYRVYQDPGADPEHRFVYVKTGWYCLPQEACGFGYSFLWLKPIEKTRREPELLPVSAEEIAEWEKIAPLLQGISVAEYTLPPGSDPRQEMISKKSLPEEALPPWAREGYTRPETPEEETATLESLGYKLETEIIEISSGQYPRQKLYRDGRLLFDYVYKVSGVYSFTTEEGILNAFTVTTRDIEGHSYNAFLIQNDAILAWRYSIQDPPFDPVPYQDGLLWLKAGQGYVDVVKTTSEKAEVLYTFSVYTEPIYSTEEFTNWNTYWVWSARDFLIQDGVVLNERLGFQEIFEWRLIDNKPAYLFRKDGRVGFSYDGKITPLEYQSVAHLMCCGFAANNPSMSEDSAYFFAERNGVWYYVVLKFR